MFLQPKSPSTEEWIKKMWYVYAMERYLARKRSKTVQSAEMQLDLETHTEWRKSKREKKKSYNNFYMWNVENDVGEFICKAEV